MRAVKKKAGRGSSTLSPVTPVPAGDPKKVLVVQLGPLADFVAAMTAFARIRAAHPRARIILLTIPRFEALARASPYFNAVMPDGAPSGLGEWLSLRGRLKAAEFDRVYDLQWGGARSFLPPAWPNPRRKLPGEEQMHPLEREARLLQLAGLWDDAPTGPGEAAPPDLGWILERARSSQRAPISPRPYVVLAPGGLAKSPERRWPVEFYAELAKVLKGRGLDIVITGRPDESALARAIQRAVPTARDLTGGSDFAQIAILGARAVLAIGGDTGVTHLIAAAGAPTIAILPSDRDAVRDGPRGHVMVVQGADLTKLSVQTVANAALSLLPA
ncbi:MAG: ADP-heptose--LPS heptosyltransferase [Caulobacteraceae bacterium]|nr:ADP-heptose--LPS heptosyltransferase [Caulobacteraceae bacterium]